MRKIIKEEFIRRARETHGDKYNYDKVVYVNENTQVIVTCPIHGDFLAIPRTHLRGVGCGKCGPHHRRNTEDFIKESSIIHNNKFDYSKTVFKNFKTKVCIICPKHGEFWQFPQAHLIGKGCWKCAHETLIDGQRSTTEEFVEKAREVHGDKYDYSNVEYKKNRTKVCIICPEHGEFWQTPYNHLCGSGCPKCLKSPLDDPLVVDERRRRFVDKATEKHDGKYDYSKVVYKKAKEDVCIVCPEHGEFWQKIGNHLNGQGCPECAKIVRGMATRLTTEEFIRRANEIHHGFYDYSETVYVEANAKVRIRCPKHGFFEQYPYIHTAGAICPQCSNERAHDRNAFTTEMFVKRAVEKFGDKYDYSKVVYYNSNTPITIICPVHGEYQQTPLSHLSGRNCPCCGIGSSSAEEEIKEFIQDLGIECVSRDRKMLKGWELDIYIPTHHLAIEYNGIRWHSELFGKNSDYHLRKTEQCESLGIRLIHVFEDAWIGHKDAVLNKLKSLLLQYQSPHETQSDCECCENSAMVAQPFFNKYHEYGFVNCDVYISFLINGEILSMMGFYKRLSKDKEWELLRFANKSGANAVENGKRILSYFVQHYAPKSLQVCVDRCWESNSIDATYQQIGFSLVRYTKPCCRYVRINGSNITTKNELIEEELRKQYAFPSTMTLEEMTNKLKFYRVWDCGCIIYDFPTVS